MSIFLLIGTGPGVGLVQPVHEPVHVLGDLIAGAGGQGGGDFLAPLAGAATLLLLAVADRTEPDAAGTLPLAAVLAAVWTPASLWIAVS